MRATVRASLGFLFLALAAVAGAQQIQFAEPVELAVEGSAAQFDAYGRRFSLSLSDNERVLSKLPIQRKQQLRGYRLMRGALDGQPGSWVRLTESAAGVEGAIWDGRELYAVTRYEQIAPFLTTPLTAAPDQTVVYRLSDARDLLPKDFCALHADKAGAQKQTALDQYQAMVADLQQGVIEARITRQIEISLLADSQFAESQYPDPNAAMIARLNIVEGIFSEQVGLLILATDMRIMDANDDPFVATQGATLLEQLGKYRASTAAVRARGLAHLMTGKNLDGTTAGIAYVDSVCTTERGVSVSEQSHGTTISALIMAHELGHNLGAPHDGEVGACAAVTGGFIMAPSVSGFGTFSQCSIDVMQAVLETASCVTPADYADAAVAAPANSVSAEGGLPFTLPFVVRSAGTATAQDLVFSVNVPETSGVTLESISADGASCTTSATLASCSFGDLPAGEQRTVSIGARGMLAGVITARARVTAANDKLTSNNSRDVSINLRSGIDAAVALSTDATEIALGAPLQVYADVRSLRTLPVRNAVLSLNLNQTVISASMPGATCAANAFSVTCNISELPAGAERRLTVLAQSSTPGPLFAVGNISASGDGDLTNNSGSARGWVQADRDIELTAGPGTVELGIGSSYELPLLVSSRGLRAASDVTLQVSVPAAIVIDSIDAEGAPCSTPENGSFKCRLGSLSPGASALVRVRVHGTSAATVSINAVADAADDGYAANNSSSVQLRLDNAVDLGLLLASGGSGIEDQDIEGQVSVSSGGRQSAIGATLDIELHAAGTLRHAAIHNGADCELLSRQRARCTLPVLARGSLIYVDYRVQFADPGTFDIKFLLTTPGDTAADNDALARPILVRPHNDVAVSGDLDLTRMLVGSTRETRFTVSTGQRDLASARFIARHDPPGVRVNAIRADGGTCQVDEDIGGVCDFADLAAGSTRIVVVTWQAEGSADSDATVSVATAGDVAMGNNTVTGHVEVFATTDVELRVASAASGATGQPLDFPAISVVNGGGKAIDTRLEITLPSGVSLVSISAANAICSGTAALRCDFDDLAPNSTSTVNISLRASTRGSYTSSLKLTSLNDSNASNDSREVAFEISGSTGVATATRSSGGGGGGSLEWLSLLLLAGMAASRLRQAAPPL